MINFPVPQSIGFGIARGTACCLFSGEEILDYSGDLLNLASRLNDLARPSGIVLDGNYLRSVIPATQRDLFRKQSVYLRSIAEEKPVNILYLDKYVQVSELSLSPLSGENWQTIVQTFTKAQFLKLRVWEVDLPSLAKSKEKIRVTVTVPKKGLKGMVTIIDVVDFRYVEDRSDPVVEVTLEKAQKDEDVQLAARNAEIILKVEYVPRLLRRT
jgi:hypothetical protein